MAFSDFLGTGNSFPFKVENNKMAMSSGEALIGESIKIILCTEPGERLMQPEFGAGLGTLVFSENNISTATLIAEKVEDALKTWEPRIEVLNVNVMPDGDVKNLLNIGIEYKVLTSNAKQNMVFPFYLQGAE